jgi:hypothetical protein
MKVSIAAVFTKQRGLTCSLLPLLLSLLGFSGEIAKLASTMPTSPSFHLAKPRCRKAFTNVSENKIEYGTKEATPAFGARPNFCL